MRRSSRRVAVTTTSSRVPWLVVSELGLSAARVTPGAASSGAAQAETAAHRIRLCTRPREAIRLKAQPNIPHDHDLVISIATSPPVACAKHPAHGVLAARLQNP